MTSLPPKLQLIATTIPLGVSIENKVLQMIKYSKLLGRDLLQERINELKIEIISIIEIKRILVEELCSSFMFIAESTIFCTFSIVVSVYLIFLLLSTIILFDAHTFHSLAVKYFYPPPIKIKESVI